VALSVVGLHVGANVSGKDAICAEGEGMKNIPPTKYGTRHDCWRAGWVECVVCGGHMHQQGCTSKRDPEKDCCQARHQMLHDRGHVVGLVDSSIPMLPW